VTHLAATIATCIRTATDHVTVEDLARHTGATCQKVARVLRVEGAGIAQAAARRYTYLPASYRPATEGRPGWFLKATVCLLD
jgi:hypothetical protein